MDENKELVRNTEAKNLFEAMKEMEQLANIEQMLKDNNIIFKAGEMTYRVRKPDGIEQMEVEDYRRRKYVELVKDPTYLFRKEWVEIYRKKGIDIEQMEREVITLQNEINSMMLRLARTDNKTDIARIETEILAKKAQQAKITVEKTDLLNYSVEDQIIVSVNSYYAFITLEKQVGDKWEKVFKTHDEFVASKDETLINKTLYYINFLIYSNSF